MSVAFTWNWRVKAKRLSLVDPQTYEYDFPAAQTRQAADELRKELIRIGYDSVEVVLIHTIP